MGQLPGWEQELMRRAESASRQAYAPYSDFAVGAAVLCPDGSVFTGVNVENASYGLTVCAERNAVAAAVSAGYTRFEAVAVWAAKTPRHTVQPCGACRQVLAEFMGPDGQVIACHPETGSPEVRLMSAVLPWAFDLQADRCTDNS